ncbi:MAG: hypothetical protein QOH70_3505 [Blastocatellia bacterium]|nr:hypothetical protein [Blastocatellia bacterium]
MPAKKPKSPAQILKRRNFLALFPGALASVAFLPLINSHARALSQSPGQKEKKTTSPACWLDVAAPFIVEDAEIGLHSEIVLTSDTFVGAQGYADGADKTEYEIYLYEADGKAVGAEGVAKRLVVPAMQMTVLSVREILGDGRKFWGGMRIRLRPKGRQPMHASDLFSSAFVRWKTAASFDNVHANPDPLQWQRPDKFFYSMPFPPLAEYAGIFSLFNPYAEQSRGAITLYDQLGSKLTEAPYELKPHSSLLFDLRQGEFINDPRRAFVSSDFHNHRNAKLITADGGTIAITNQPGSVKGFGYLLIKRAGGSRFSVEHPIHQAPFKPAAAPAPFDSAGRFKAKNILYTPLLFRSKRIGGLTLDSRFHFSSGAPLEEFLRINPFITDGDGKVAWQVTDETKLPATISDQQIERGVIKLGGMQSCLLDCAHLPLPKAFSGGLSLAVAPTTNHTLMKVETSVKEWGAHAFTHFRPGLQSARGYQSSPPRGGLATDYIASGARVERDGNKILRDEVIGVMNIDDKGLTGRPALEVFTSKGLLTRIDLGEVPGFACRHYLLSELSSGKIGPHDLSLRLVDEHATLLMSVVHLDYARRDLALDHGSDRFSTFNDYSCELSA